MSSYFKKNYGNLQYPIPSEKESGLRNAQHGAIHAIGAFLTLDKKQPGIVVMPTGSGKTSVIMMAPYLAQSKKVLIITTSKIVRSQIFEDYKRLDTLKSLNVFNIFINPPVVFEMKRRYPDKMNEIQSADVVITTFQCALSLTKSEIKESFDMILIDEAHHIPAPTWQQILNDMIHAKSFLFTATPFRRDRKEIKGEIIYNYPLSKAYKDGIFGEIQYFPIEEASEKDILIAKETERIFLNDKQNGLDHFIMVRTSNKNAAKQLELLYKKETKLRLMRIDSSMPYVKTKKCLEDLKNHILDGIICINMLGEGFDFPRLKIAAIHSPHKSLSSILQFIGRFARTNADDIGTAKFIAMNDSEFTVENEKLFTSEVLWKKLIVNMSETRIQTEEEIKTNLANYIRDDGVQIWETDISLYNLRPNYHAKVYRVTDFNINGTFPDYCCVGDNIYRNIQDSTIIAIGTRIEKPKWGISDQILDSKNFLYIVHFQQETSLMFIYSQQKTEIDYQGIAKSFAGKFDKIIRSEIHRVLAGSNNFELFNTGMQNKSPGKGESYRILAGSNVASSIDMITGRLFYPGHVFCKAIDSQGKEITIGYSSGSKIWSSKYSSIPEYIRWCDSCGANIVNSSIKVKTNTNYDNLPMSTLLTKYPDKTMFCVFSHKTFSSPPLIIDKHGNLTDFVLTDSNIIILEQKDELVKVKISIDDTSEIVTCDNKGDYYCDNQTMQVKDGRNKSPLSDYLTNNPLSFIVSDGSLIIGHEVFAGNENQPIFSKDIIIPFDWELYSTDKTCEFGISKNGGRTIHDTVFEILSAKDNFDAIIYDHGSGEIADFITIKERAMAIDISLFHIKSMKGLSYNNNLSDIYEVCQQGIKSIHLLNSSSALQQKIIDRQKSNHCIVRLGNRDYVKEILNGGKTLSTKIVIVQPAIKKDLTIPDKFQEILAAANMYITNNGQSESFEIWGS